MENSSASQTTFMHLIFKTLGGLGGGMVGTVLAVVMFLVASASLEPVLTRAAFEPTEVPPFFIFILMFMIFLSTLGSNLVGSLLLGLSEKFRYTKIGAALSQIFFLNLIMFVVLIPVYLIVSKIELAFVSYVVGVHILISAQGSALVLEMVSNTKHAVVGIYATILASLFASGIAFILYTVSGSNASILLFTIFPVLWISIGLMEGILELVYGAIVSATGKDFLAVKE